MERFISPGSCRRTSLFWNETQSPVIRLLAWWARGHNSHIVSLDRNDSTHPQHKCYLQDDSSWTLTAKSLEEDGWNLNLKCASVTEDGVVTTTHALRTQPMAKKQSGLIFTCAHRRRSRLCQRDFSIQSYGSSVGEGMFWQTLLHWHSLFFYLLSCDKNKEKISCIFWERNSNSDLYSCRNIVNKRWRCGLMVWC